VTIKNEQSMSLKSPVDQKGEAHTVQFDLLIIHKSLIFIFYY
jgi:hypothetical protein